MKTFPSIHTEPVHIIQLREERELLLTAAFLLIMRSVSLRFLNKIRKINIISVIEILSSKNLISKVLNLKFVKRKKDHLKNKITNHY